MAVNDIPRFTAQELHNVLTLIITVVVRMTCLGRQGCSIVTGPHLLPFGLGEFAAEELYA